MESPLKGRVLIVDDISQNIQVAMSILHEDDYDFSFAVSGEEALGIINKSEFDLILLDVMMPGLNGYDVCKKIKAGDSNQETPIIFLTALTDLDSISAAFNAGGVDYITKPFHAEELLSRVRVHMQLYRTQKLLKQKNIETALRAQMQTQQLQNELDLSNRETIYILMEVMESTSDETGSHTKRVAELSRLLANLVESLSEAEETIILLAAPMHDIGKILVPKSILNKPGKLTEDEFEIMKTHAHKGSELLAKSNRPLISAASIIAQQHHEKWDGTGYPNGLRGEDIHIYGRIVALADVFDALTHKRQYKKAWSSEQAIEYIKENSGHHFDPYLVNLFIENIDEFLAVIDQNQ
jgi:putative two-component system response regulator